MGKDRRVLYAVRTSKVREAKQGDAASGPTKTTDDLSWIAERGGAVAVDVPEEILSRNGTAPVLLCLYNALHRTQMQRSV